MVDRIKAAVDARTDEAFVIMARTDALASEGLDAAIERAQAYVAAGADMIFAEAVTELADVHASFARPSACPSSPTSPSSARRRSSRATNLATAGVDIILYCCAAYRAMNAAALKVYETIRTEGTQKERDAADADARRTLQISRLSRLRTETRRTLREGKKNA